VTDASTYTIYRAITSDSNYAIVDTVATNSYSDSGLLASTRYYYKVKASNSNGTSTFSAYAYAVTSAPSGVPEVPANLTAAAISSKEIELTWDPAFDATSYNIFRSTTENGTYSKIANSVKDTTYHNTGLTVNTTYYYQVQAANNRGVSTYSNKDSATTLTAPAIPSAPTGLTATAENSSTISLDWVVVNRATSYYVYRATSSSGTYSKVATVTDNFYSDSGLLASTTYYYKVKAYNESGLSTFSSGANAKTFDSTGIPDIPTNLTAHDTGSNSIDLNWDGATDAASYYLYRATSSSGTYTKIATVKATFYNDSGLTTGRTYYYKVRAYNSYGLSEYSNRASATVSRSSPNISDIPDVPDNLDAIAKSSSSIDLDWSYADNATSYYLYRATSSSGTYSRIATVSSETYTDTGLSANTTYYYKVQAHNSYGTSSFSASASATTYSSGYYESNFNRFAGQDRYETAARIAQEGWSSSYYAVIASGEDFPDALCGTPLAGKYDAPILLTSRSALENQTRYALSNLDVQEVFIIGGTGVISSAVEQKIEDMGITVIRIAGSDRYETSVKVAEKLGSASQAVIATGENFPDALSIAPIASMKGYPILLATRDQLPAVIKKYLNDNIQDTVVVGGTGVIGSYVYNQLPSPTRLSGYDRYETNLRIVEEYVNDLDFTTCYIATGENFPDALAGSALASNEQSPIILVSSVVSGATTNFLNNQDVIDYIAFGGTAVVSDRVMRDLGSSTSGSSGSLSAPDNLSATAVGPNEIDLDWDSVSNATSYYIYRSTSYSGTYSRIDIVNTSYYYDTDVSEDTTYYYKIQAHNSSGTSAYSSRVDAMTNSGVSLDAPTNLDATALSSSSIYLTWDSVSDATSYYIYRATSSNGSYTRIATVSREYYTNTGLSSGRTYYYKVQAHNSSDTSSYSANAFATTD
ncbi:MAG TPA: cell wall-binding repeat-containing protein, partial [Desulfitobacteriaceae bacterium]|nr:cell wall-binding repeat-containing protein [Desulfitobacteriaceae bacterium]